MKKKISFLRALVVLFSLGFMANVFAVGDPGTLQGSGTQEDPYLIGTPADLLTIGDGGTEADFKGKHYKFMSDIDMTGVAGVKMLYHNGGFDGYIDGNGFAIKNGSFSTQVWLKTIVDGTPIGHVGGVFYNFKGTMKNLGFENITLYTAATVLPEDRGCAGIISNTLQKDSKIENCYAINCNLNRGSAYPVGGLFGMVYDTTATVIKNCWADVTITSNNKIGGIAGKNGGQIEDVAFYGTIVPTVADSAYTIAQNMGTGTVTDAYYKDGSAAAHATDGSTAVVDLKDQASFSGLDFVARPGWIMGDNYPVLKLYPTEPFDVTYMNVGDKNNPRNLDSSTNDDGLLIFPPLDSIGYVFEGWYRDAAMLDKVEDSIAVVKSEKTLPDTTFYAKWVADAVYNINYENMGGAENLNNPLTFANDTAVVLHPASGYKAGVGDSELGDSLFVGWYTDAALTIPANNPAIRPGMSADQTFYAKWMYRPCIAGGDGTEVSPYLVSTAYDLQNINALQGWSHFQMINSIDMEGQAFTPIANLSGVFDGNESVIKNLKINGSGFCGQLSGTIKNLGLLKLSVTGSGATATGGFAGSVWNATPATETAPEKHATLENCYIEGDTISGGIAVGAFFGNAWTSGNVVRNCYADVVVKGTDEVGGLFGRTHLKDASGFENCIFYGEVITNGANNGAIIGKRQAEPDAGNPDIPASFYYLEDVTSTTNQGDAEAIAWDDFSDEDNTPELDFDNVWKIEYVEYVDRYNPVLMYYGLVNSEEELEVKELSIFPNPSDGIFYFDLEAAASVVVTDLAGKVVYAGVGEVGRNTLDLTTLVEGIYFVTIKDVDSYSINQVVVK